MPRKKKSRYWRSLLVVVGLFGLSFLAPRHWLNHFELLWSNDSERARFVQRMFGGGHEVVESNLLHRSASTPSQRVTLKPRRNTELNLPPRPDDAEIPSQQIEEHLVAWEELTDAGIEAHFASESGSTAEVDYGPLVASRYDDNGAEVLPPPISAFARPLEDLQLQRPHQLGQAALGEQGAVTVWPRPTALIEQLERIEGHQRSQKWAQQVLDALDELATVDTMDSAHSEKLLASLTQLSRDVPTFALSITNLRLQSDVRAAAAALERRVDVWQQVQKLLARQPREQFISTVETSAVRRQVQAALASIPGKKAPPAWRRYLELDQLTRSLQESHDNSGQRAAIARLTLERMHADNLTARQRSVVATPAFEALDASLRQLATQPVEALEMLYLVEQFEATESLPDARRLAIVAAHHRFSTDEAAAELVRRIDANYRGANVRTAITAELFNRLLPQPQAKTDEVGEQILAAWVAGERTTKTELSLKLIPDDDQWRMGMEAHGKTESDTASYSGNAVIYTQGVGTFEARKLIVVDHHTIHVWPAEADASFENWLYGVGTNYDSLPIVGRIARNSASQQFGANQWAAQREVEARMRKRAAKMLDREAHRPLIAAEGQFEKRVLVPLTGAAVEPTALKMFTMKERVVGDYRLAGVSQLGGHTPRPWAPRGSLLSIQLHESAINNVIAGLRLDGREDSLENVYREIWQVFGVARDEMRESMPESVRVHFADEEAVRIRLEDGRMEVIIRLAELQTEKRTWRDLVVRNFYAPDSSTRQAVLVRDSTVRLVGERLGLRDQIALRGIFSKIFAGNSEFPLLGEQLANNPGVADLQVTQYIIHDGWIGLALGLPPEASAVGAGQSLPLDREARRTTSRTARP